MTWHSTLAFAGINGHSSVVSVSRQCDRVVSTIVLTGKTGMSLYQPPYRFTFATGLSH